MSNTNMADAAAARREARRKKILENSHNRLKIISGKSTEESPRESPIRNIIPELDYDFPATVTTSSHASDIAIHNGLLYNQSELFELLSGTNRNFDSPGSGDGETTSDLTPLLLQQSLVPPTAEPTEPPTLSLWEKVITHKYDIVLLSLFLQILHSISLITFDNGYFFLPVIVYVVTKLIWVPTQSNSGIANVLMLLNGMSPARVQGILFVTQIFGVVTRDIFVFLFTTICVQSLLITLKDGVGT